MASFSDFLERNFTLVLALQENHLQESNDSDFLCQILHFMADCMEPLNVFSVLLGGCIKFDDLTATKRLKQVVNPLEISVDQ